MFNPSVSKHLKAFLLSLFILMITPSLSVANTVMIDQMWSLESPLQQPPKFHFDTTAETQWERVDLPDIWNQRRKDKGGQVWYHSNFNTTEVNGHLWAVYLPKSTESADIFINGQAIGQSGQTRLPLSRNWVRPYLFEFPSSVLKTGTNQLAIKLAAYPNSNGALFPVKIGHANDLNDDYKSRYFWQITMAEITSFILFCLAFVTLFLWRFFPRDGLFLSTSLISLTASIICAQWWIKDIPFSNEQWYLIFSTAIGWYVFGIVFFISTFFQIKIPKLIKAYAVYQIVAMITLSYSNPENIVGNLIYLKFFDIIVVLFVSVLILKEWRRHNRNDLCIILFAIIFSAALGVHDLLNILLDKPIDDINIFYLGTLSVFFVIIWLLISRHLSALNDYLDINKHLQQRVEDRTQELVETHSKLINLERNNAISQERQRLMQDLHDGMGGHLVSALACTENTGNDNEALQDILNYAMQDLRLMVDSLDCDDDGFITVLGMFRQRMEPVLEQKSITLEWEIIAEPLFKDFGPSQSVIIMRIMQEAVTNVIKHAGATSIHVRIKEKSLQIKDNGKGFNVEQTQSSGYGLSGMKKRAKQIDAQLDIIDKEGIEVTISWS